ASEVWVHGAFTPNDKKEWTTDQAEVGSRCSGAPAPRSSEVTLAGANLLSYTRTQVRCRVSDDGGGARMQEDADRAAAGPASPASPASPGSSGSSASPASSGSSSSLSGLRAAARAGWMGENRAAARRFVACYELFLECQRREE